MPLYVSLEARIREADARRVRELGSSSRRQRVWLRRYVLVGGALRDLWDHLPPNGPVAPLGVSVLDQRARLRSLLQDRREKGPMQPRPSALAQSFDSPELERKYQVLAKRSGSVHHAVTSRQGH